MAWHAPAATDADFFPMLVLDAALTGAKGVNLWASFPGLVAAAQGATLYRAGRARARVVGQRRAAADAQPFLYTLALTAIDGVGLRVLESALLEAVERLRANGVTRRGGGAGPQAAPRPPGVRERQRHEHCPPARLLRDGRRAPISWLGLQAGIDGVTAEQVSDVARRRLGREDAHGRLVPASGLTVMAIGLRRGLSPAKTTLANGARPPRAADGDGAGRHDRLFLRRRQPVRPDRPSGRRSDWSAASSTAGPSGDRRA